MRSKSELDAALRLIDLGQSDGSVAEATGIPRRTICGWRLGQDLRRARLRVGPGEPCCEMHDFSRLPGEEYAYLLGLYLGDGCISAARRGVWGIRITLDSGYPRIIDSCARALEAIFPEKNAHIGKRSNSHCVDVSMWSKHWPCLIPQHGPGRKHLRHISLEEWQKLLLKGHRDALLRGLIFSDGTRIVATERKGRYVRRAPRYAFSNRSEDILRIFCESCDLLGVRWTRASDHQIAVYRLESVARLDEFVGPKR